MKLKELLSEMSMPTINTAEQAVRAIKEAYNSAVVKKQANGDFYGALIAGLKFLQNSTNPEKYTREIKQGLAAKKAVEKNRAALSAAQAQHTAVK